MLRDGPISSFLHGVIEYATGALLIVAPFLLGFDSGAATAVSIVLGVGVIGLSASSDLPTGLVAGVSGSLHAAIDFCVAALLIASPFIFGFSAETEPTVLFMVLGVLHLLVTIGTRFRARGQQAD